MDRISVADPDSARVPGADHACKKKKRGGGA